MQPGEEIKNVILMGDYISEIMRRISKNNEEMNMVEARKFISFLKKAG